jgi:predicted membrane-bound mannosyltransferase
MVGDSRRDEKPSLAGELRGLIGALCLGIMPPVGGRYGLMQQQLGADNAAPGWLAWTVGIRDALPTLLALAISVCFAVILLGTIGFPLVTHADEPSKALAVLKHRNNFNHPLLMLHLGRGANALAGFATAPNVIELGRTLAVIAGALAVFATYLLARQVLPAPASLAAATATAVAPLVAMHARFFKEDIFALPFVLFSLLLLIEVLKTPTRGRALLLGVAAGLTLVNAGG